MMISVYNDAPKEVRSSVIAAQAADTMIYITGVCMSVVITEYTADNSKNLAAAGTRRWPACSLKISVLKKLKNR